MSFASRLKERREALGITQPELAALLGVSKGAIGNYETGVNSPRAAVLYKLFDVLRCDANYLFQDELPSDTPADGVTLEEFELLIKKYRALDEPGKKLVGTVLDQSYDRVIASSPENRTADVVPLNQADQTVPDYLLPNAAHEDNPTPEQRKHADDIMNNDELWK